MPVAMTVLPKDLTHGIPRSDRSQPFDDHTIIGPSIHAQRNPPLHSVLRLNHAGRSVIEVGSPAGNAGYRHDHRSGCSIGSALQATH